MLAGWLFNPDHDKIVARALGLVLSGSLILLYVGLKLTPKKIGA